MEFIIKTIREKMGKPSIFPRQKRQDFLPEWQYIRIPSIQLDGKTISSVDMNELGKMAIYYEG
jgi:hypothetical protein